MREDNRRVSKAIRRPAWWSRRHRSISWDIDSVTLSLDDFPQPQNPAMTTLAPGQGAPMKPRAGGYLGNETHLRRCTARPSDRASFPVTAATPVRA
jgi:hypothetical protein